MKFKTYYQKKKMKKIKSFLVICIICSGFLLSTADNCIAYINIRISVNFMTDANGNTPNTPDGNIETEQDVRDAIDECNWILSNCRSEFRLQLIDIRTVIDAFNPGLYFNDEWDWNTWNKVRNRARDFTPEIYNWDSDAINVYINEGPSPRPTVDWTPGITSYDVQMIGMANVVGFDTFIHELSHIFGLLHTFHTNPECRGVDLAEDDASWQNIIRDVYTDNVWGRIYNDLTPEEQRLADNTFFNVMSYRNIRDRLTPCQLNNFAEGYSNHHHKNKIVSRTPIYINPDSSGPESGGYKEPYHTLEKALDSEDVNNRVLVFEGGHSYQLNGPLNADTILVPRLGHVTIMGPGFESWKGESFWGTSITVRSFNAPVYWQTNVEGLVFLGQSSSGTIEPNSNETIKIRPIGFGPITITITINDVEKVYSALLLGIITLNLEEVQS
jgi:hypothetical protein